MEVGDLVTYNDRFDLSRIPGKSGVKSARGVIYDEHIGDLTIICENR